MEVAERGGAALVELMGEDRKVGRKALVGMGEEVMGAEEEGAEDAAAVVAVEATSTHTY